MGLPPRGRLSVQMTGLQMFLAKVSSNGLGWRDFLSYLFISFVKNRHRQLVNLWPWLPSQPSQPSASRMASSGTRSSGRPWCLPWPWRTGRCTCCGWCRCCSGDAKTVVVRELVWQVENLAISVGVQPSLLAWFPVPLALTCRESGK